MSQNKTVLCSLYDQINDTIPILLSLVLNFKIMLNRKITLILLLLIMSLSGYSLKYEIHSVINWSDIQRFSDNALVVERLSFEGAYYHETSGLPTFFTSLKIHTSEAILNVSLKNEKYIKTSPEESILLSDRGYIKTDVIAEARIIRSRKQPLAQVELIPIRWNEEKSTYEKLVDFDIVIEVLEDITNDREATIYANSSVLSNGSWYKIRLDKSGIYKLTYEQLSSMGFDVSVHPSKIALFGNGGGLLPEKNDEFRYDDLYENPMQVVGGDDGSFDNGDYILFYGEGPVVWNYNSSTNAFYHNTNYYRDFSYYFISTKENAKRIENLQPPGGTVDVEVNNFTDYIVHEIDERNLAGIGRTWFGEIYDYITEYDFTYDFPNTIKNSENAYFRGYFASRAYSASSFSVFMNNDLGGNVIFQPLSTGDRYTYARGDTLEFSFAPTSDQLDVSTVYNRSSSTSVGYLDYFEINVQRSLSFTGDQLIFRKDLKNANVAQYTLSNSSQNIEVWDITTSVNPYRVIVTHQTNSLTFNSDATSLHEYIAFNGNSFLTPEFVEVVPNQNLHSYRNIDYLIIAYPDFIAEAEELADFHRSMGDMSILVTTIDKVYNEFSSGGQDITAIRDFAKMLYDDSDPGKELKYLLLFGDASYDYKDILPDNTNFVPCWESVKSLDIVSSIASDDYFGFLDDGEGVELANDLVDIGIGRFVVANSIEASAAIDKTINYTVNTSKVMGPWRNVVTFVADDGDSNRHLDDAEELSNIIETDHKVYNISKIYADAYEQISTPSGQAAPAVNQAINERINKGTLIFNYSGHGGEIGLGHERIVQIPDIISWQNYDKLAVFITATCEFTRYDDPNRVSAGELVFLNDKGGAVSLFTTSRATFAGSNLALNKAIYNNNMFKKIDGEYPRFGDIIRKSKLYGTANDKKFVLIGDPACRMAYPEYIAETVRINSNIVVSDEYDTIRALQLVKVEGIVTDDEGTKLTDFNGELFSSVYDKKVEIQTFGDESSSTSFYVRNSVIFNGKASIINGDFNFEFMVPKDIAYKYGDGRISYYFRDTVTDGNGYYENIVVGGFDDNAKVDTEGPVINLFMNDTTFLSGGITNQNPNLIAFVSDSSGINTTGNGIGHDIVTVINEDKLLTYVLNEYYEASQNKYNQGIITYPFSELPDGDHSLSLKVWDVYNNSSTAYLDFTVVSSEEVIVDNLMNYPNPFINETKFVFDHNQSGNTIKVSIDIFRLDGKLIKKIVSTLDPEGHRSEPIVWNGTTDSGGVIARGFYVYRVTVTNEAGSVATDTSKLVYIR